MNTSIVGRHIDLTPSIKEHIEAAIGSFDKFNLDIIGIHSIVSQAEKNGKHTFTFELTMVPWKIFNAVESFSVIKSLKYFFSSKCIAFTENSI